jgi:hypothetical protein
LQEFKLHVLDPSLKNLDCTSLEEDPQLTSSIVTWVQKLKDAKDFKTLQIRSLFSTRVLSVVQYSMQNPKYLKFFKKELVEVTSSCVDNASLGLNTLEMKKKIMQSSNGSLKTILQLFKGDFAIKLLQKCAVEKVHQCREDGIHVDDLEVELALQVKLRERLNLPLECKDMNFAYFAHLTDTDLDKAEKYVKDALKTKFFCDFLMDQKIWKSAVEKNHSDIFLAKLDPIRGEQNDLDKYVKGISSEEYLVHSDYLREKYEGFKEELLLEITEKCLSETTTE